MVRTSGGTAAGRRGRRAGQLPGARRPGGKRRRGTRRPRTDRLLRRLVHRQLRHPPYNQEGDRTLCFQAKENYPAVATRRLADKGIKLNVQSDVSCEGALIHHFWEEQELLPGSSLKVPPQQDALKADTRLVVGSMGGNTLGFTRILKQCSDKLRGPEHALLPGEPVNGDQPAAKCREFFESGDGKQWLDQQFEQVGWDLEELLDRIHYFAPDSKRVLVGYPRLVPAGTTKCLTPAPGQTQLPLADIPQNALPVLDQIQKRLDDTMKKAAADAEGGADFVDLYTHTGSNTACDGANRGIGGLLENSQIGGHAPLVRAPQ
ncbi:SGNH/GDSL hydrolase family protein [Streptomyces violascens]|uniref:SGNH/GDSL hydrolase family protein n=1 Tax=Streptomyces violascens TaxID=67381 RepID=UPI00365CFDE8